MVLSLQQQALKPDSSVVSLLRFAKVIATKLDLKEALVWINNELDGYPNALTKDLPDYRRIHGIPKAWNPYRGWQTINGETSDTIKKISLAPIGQAIGAIEHDLARDHKEGGGFTFPYPPDLKRMVQKAINWDEDVHIAIEASQLVNIIDQVKNLILNWTLELEQAGVLGEEMSFTQEERTEAPAASQNFFIQNAGVVGNVSGQSSVTNSQVIAQPLDMSKVTDLLQQTSDALDRLPEALRKELEPLLTALAEESSAKAPNEGKLKDILSSVRKVAESASGNLTAQGIIHLSRVILGA